MSSRCDRQRCRAGTSADLDSNLERCSGNAGGGVPGGRSDQPRSGGLGIARHRPVARAGRLPRSAWNEVCIKRRSHESLCRGHGASGSTVRGAQLGRSNEEEPVTTQTREPAVSGQLQQLMINTIRTLSIDAVQKANSGHPGAPLGMAPAGYTLFTRFLRYNPHDPNWPNRDRFILSAGHASMLLYSLLYLTGYGLTLDDIKQFRQWGSITPGHPERGLTPGVEATTGPLGQGFANGVGLAIAEAYLRSYFNRPGFDVVDHHIYAMVSDGDLEEGVTAEAASLAGHLKLGRLIYLYDRNQVQ